MHHALDSNYRRKISARDHLLPMIETLYKSIHKFPIVGSNPLTMVW